MKTFLSFIAIVAVFSMYSCHEIDYESKKQEVQDSLVTILPRWQAIHLEIGDNYTSMLIVVGDATFYNAPQDVKTKKAEELGKMILRIFGKGNYLEKGILIVTADIHNTSPAPPDGISIPIDFTALKKGMGK